MAAGFEKHQKRTRRAEFLLQMDIVVPWRDLVEEIEPFYPKAGNGRPPVGLERMLRMYFLQAWFNLSDPAVEEALYESLSMRAFVGIDLGREPVPDETTVCKFRHLLERHGLGARIFARVNGYLDRHGLKIGTGTIVDATILAAPSSTKNKSGQRDPEMHQTRKGNEWHFGMKAHVGVDADTKLVHTVAATAANVADPKMLSELLHGEETAVWGDQAYQGQAAVLAEHAPEAEDRICRRWRSKLQVWPEQRERNRLYSKVRSRVEHVFGILKLRFGFAKVRYRGLAKNLHRLQVSFALVNLVTAQKHLAPAGQ
ncbi:MAG: IS5 family transposase [Acidobacteriota bacterium]|nr:IS5 family transposase [Acidobacteriota bacterium]